MKRFAVILAVLAALGGTACSKSALTSGAAAIDSPATSVCKAVEQLIQARTTGVLNVNDLRARASAINDDAQASENPLIRARAAALYASATVQAAGGMAPNFDADLAALNSLCAGGGVEAA
jgi:hypothetical protein